MKSKFLKMLTTMSVATMIFGSIAVSADTTTGTSTTGQTVDVTFNQQDTVQLTLSSNTVDFGTVTSNASTVASTSPTDLVASVKSSATYNMDIVATDDFSNTTLPTATKVPISKLGVKVDGGSFSNFTGTNVSKSLVSNASDTSTLPGVTRTHTIDFSLDTTIGYKAGSYTAPLSISVTQK